MGVVSVHVFRTQPGRLADHEALSAEGRELLVAMGLPAITLRCIVGADIGTIATVVNYASFAEFGAANQKIAADPGWQEFWARAAASGASVPVETSLYEDVDPGWQPDTGRVLGALAALQFRAVPGRLADFMVSLGESMAHVQRIGGVPRVMRSLFGLHPQTVLVSIAFADMDALGAFADAQSTDRAWQDQMAKVAANPTAEMVRTGIYVNASG